MDTGVLDLVAVVGDETWCTPGWPVAVAGMNAVAGVALGVGLAVHSRWGGLGHRLGAALCAALTFMGVGVIGAVPLLFLPVTLLPGATFAIEAFRAPLVAEFIASLVAMFAVGAGLTAWLYAPRGTPGLPVVPLLAAPVVAALGLAGPAHVVAMNAVGPLPTMDLDLGPRLHLGADATVAVRLDDAAADGWFAPPVHVKATATGPMLIELSAERVGLRGVREVTREVGMDRGSPLFPLAAGNAWDLQETVHHDAQYLWFINGDSASQGVHTHLWVTEGAAGPLHTWQVWRSDDGGPATTWTVYAWNGQILDAADDQPFLTTGQGTEDHLTECAVRAFEGWQCACGRPPDPPKSEHAWRSPWALEGPARCSRTEEPGAVRSVFGALMVALTAGLVIDMGDASHTMILTRSGVAPPPPEPKPPRPELPGSGSPASDDAGPDAPATR